ncbi:MAG: GerAB/ArcD/ProY family transporter [Caulobacteraceae bacterium]
MVKEGIEVLGRWSQLTIMLLAFIIIADSILSATNFSYDNLRPFLYHGLKPVIASSFSAFSFPFAETVLFIAVFNFDKKKNNTFKIYYYAFPFQVILPLIIWIAAEIKVKHPDRKS